MTLTFTHMEMNLFELSQIWGDPCSLTYIEAFEGDSTDGVSLGKWCNNVAPPPVTSTGSSITVHLFMRYEFIGHFAATYSVLNTGLLH